MAIISDRYKYIYLLNPRTASTATASALIEFADGRWIPEASIKNESGKIVAPKKHTSLKELIRNKLITDEQAATYTKFVTVRNPFDSIVSAWAKKRKDYIHLLNDETSWIHAKPGYVDSMRLAIKKPFPEWVVESYSSNVDNGKDGSINRKYLQDVDVVLRYEHLAEDFERLKERLGLPVETVIPVRNKTSGREEGVSYRDYYTDHAREIAERYFAKELDILGYKF